MTATIKDKMVDSCTISELGWICAHKLVKHTLHNTCYHTHMTFFLFFTIYLASPVLSWVPTIFYDITDNYIKCLAQDSPCKVCWSPLMYLSSNFTSFFSNSILTGISTLIITTVTLSVKLDLLRLYHGDSSLTQTWRSLPQWGKKLKFNK